MSTQVDVIDELQARITANCPVFVTVDHPWFMEALDELDKETPAALIWLSGDEAAGRPTTDAGTIQEDVLTYGVWIVSPQNKQEEARSQVRSALLGWCPTEYHGGFYYAKGGAENISGDLVWWREFWRVDINC
ncbi:MAG: hypothetical protein CMH98_04705 [Oceanospirillaceae bacterium]|nr:hypothetical protein [Oceanospirillaceae bacterium]